MSPVKEIIYSDVHALLELKMVTVDRDSVQYVKDFIGPKYELPEHVIRELLCIVHMLPRTPEPQRRSLATNDHETEVSNIIESHEAVLHEDLTTLGYNSLHNRITLGKHAVQFGIFAYLSKVPSWSRKKANLMNFEICQSDLALRLTKDDTLVTSFVNNTKLKSHLYIPLGDETDEYSKSRFQKTHRVHYATSMLYALIGSIQVEHGNSKAEEFVHDVVLDGYMTKGLFDIAGIR